MVYILIKATHNFNLDFFTIPTWTDESLKKIFLNDLPLHYHEFENRGEELIDRDEIWNGGGRGNNYGFRDNDFTECAEILAAGCSFTWGAGLYEKHIWPTHIRNMTGKTVHNIGVSGGSISGTVSRIFAYIRKFGKPKTIICLFPDAFRLYLPLIPDRFTHTRAEGADLFEFYHEHKQPVLIDTGWSNWDENKRSYSQPIYSKIPHTTNEVLPAEVAFYLSIQSIHLLESFCNEVGINLIWTTWHYDTYVFFKKIQSLADKTYFKNFGSDLMNASLYTKRKDVPDEEWPDYGCHLDLKEQDKYTFLIAADTHHWGSHSQIHLAESLYKELKKMYPDIKT